MAATRWSSKPSQSEFNCTSTPDFEYALLTITLTPVSLHRAYETLSDPTRREAYDRGDHLGLNGAPTPSATSSPPHTFSSSSGRSSHYRHPFDDPYLQRHSFATSFGYPSQSRRARAHEDLDPFGLFDRMFAEFEAPMRHRSAAASRDPFSSGMAFPSLAGPSFLESFFGSGPSAFNAFPEQRSAQPAPGRSPGGSGVFRNGTRDSWSFSTSFGNARNWTGSSESRSTTIVNGKKQEVMTKTDPYGNVTVHTKCSDGTESVTINGVDQPTHHLLSRFSSEKPAKQPLAGQGTARQPYIVE